MIVKRGFWQGQKDSNSQERFWRPLCYHYIMPLYALFKLLCYCTKPGEKKQALFRPIRQKIYHTNRLRYRCRFQ